MNMKIGRGRVLHAQLLLLRGMGRVRILVITGALMVLFVLVLFRSVTSAVLAEGGLITLTLQPLLVVTAAAWGIAVWWREPPDRREHLLMLPVDVTYHEVARIAAGALWLTALVGCVMIAAVTIQSMAGHADALSGAAWSSWIAPFSGPLLAYALTATIATAARRSIETALLGIMLFGVSYAILLQQMMRNPIVMFDTAARLNLFTALGGFVSTTTTNTTFSPDGRLLEQQQVTYNAGMIPQWAFASVLWWTIALCLLAFVLWRRRRA